MSAHLAARYVNQPPMQKPVTPTAVAPPALSWSAAVAKSACRFSGVIDAKMAAKSDGSTAWEREKKSGAMTR